MNNISGNKVTPLAETRAFIDKQLSVLGQNHPFWHADEALSKMVFSKITWRLIRQKHLLAEMSSVARQRIQAAYLYDLNAVVGRAGKPFTLFDWAFDLGQEMVQSGTQTSVLTREVLKGLFRGGVSSDKAPDVLSLMQKMQFLNIGGNCFIPRLDVLRVIVEQSKPKDEALYDVVRPLMNVPELRDRCSLTELKSVVKLYDALQRKYPSKAEELKRENNEIHAMALSRYCPRGKRRSMGYGD